MGKIFLTGTSGFLGSHVARVLSDKGIAFVGLVRREQSVSLLENMPVEYCKGDILSPGMYGSELQSCDAVIHTAAVASFNNRGAIYHKVNYEGTKTLLEVSQKCNIRKFIYISSRGTLGVANPPETSDETCIRASLDHLDDYMKSKYLAERLVLEYAQKGHMDCVVLSPTALVGRYDERPTPIGNIIKMFLRGRVKAYVDGGINIIDVEDAALGIISALEKGKSGAIYILGNENIALAGVFSILSELSGVRMPKIKIPYVPAYLAVNLIKFFSDITGRPALATPQKLYTLYHRHSYCNVGKAVRELGLPGTAIRTTLKKTVEWFLNQKLH